MVSNYSSDLQVAVARKEVTLQQMHVSNARFEIFLKSALQMFNDEENSFVRK